MNEMQGASTVSVGLFHSLKLYADQQGVDFSAAAQDAGLELSLLEDAEARIRGRIFLEGVRKKIALDYLKRSDVTLCDVSLLLGYSEQSAFNHAFKRWTGKTPREYRRE